jgi:hypothetical protein
MKSVRPRRVSAEPDYGRNAESQVCREMRRPRRWGRASWVAPPRTVRYAVGASESRL